jgi:hypothetical protein
VDDVWRVLLGEGLLATLLSFSDLTRLGILNRSSKRLHDAAWRTIWRQIAIRKMMIVLLLFLQKQNLANAIYLFGLGTLLSYC